MHTGMQADRQAAQAGRQAGTPFIKWGRNIWNSRMRSTAAFTVSSSDNLGAHLLLSTLRSSARKRICFLNLSSVCPEPVLAK